MQQEKWKDVALGGFILLIAIAGFLFINPTGAPVIEGPGGVSWRTLPFIYSGLLLILAVIFIATTLLHGLIPSSDQASGQDAAGPADETEADVTEPAPRLLWEGGPNVSSARRVAVVALLVAYSQALWAFGFAIATPVFLFCLLYTFGKRDLPGNLIVSISGGLILWLLFAHLLHMPLRGEIWDPVSSGLGFLLKGLGA